MVRHYIEAKVADSLTNMAMQPCDTSATTLCTHCKAVLHLRKGLCVHVTLGHTITLWPTLSAVAVVNSESLTHWIRSNVRVVGLVASLAALSTRLPSEVLAAYIVVVPTGVFMQSA